MRLNLDKTLLLTSSWISAQSSTSEGLGIISQYCRKLVCELWPNNSAESLYAEGREDILQEKDRKSKGLRVHHVVQL